MNFNDMLLTDEERDALIDNLSQDIGWSDDSLVDDESQYELDLERDLIGEEF